MTDVALRTERPGWTIRGRAQIDDRPAVSCLLTIRGDGSWSANLATFTLAGQVDLFLISEDGGHFCGPAGVAYSRADSEPSLRMRTELVGVGPLLVVAPAPPVDGSVEEILDAEVVGELTAS